MGQGGVPAPGRGLELDDLCGPFQHKPLYDFMMTSPTDIVLEVLLTMYWNLVSVFQVKLTISKAVPLASLVHSHQYFT